MRCIFCLKDRQPSSEHVFPEAIGGTLTIDRFHLISKTFFQSGNNESKAIPGRQCRRNSLEYLEISESNVSSASSISLYLSPRRARPRSRAPIRSIPTAAPPTQ